ncbi:MAG: glutaminyl-peptide cyclotransferase [Nitrospirae bacterium]|nr:glutaminyl-peptide cyclotransferase [Nitrospirota bacterium]
MRAISAVMMVLIMWSVTLPAAAQIIRIPQKPVSDSKHKKADQHIASFTYKIVNTFPHDNKAFTQGLVFDDGTLYEGTGLNGSSSLRKIKYETGELLLGLKLPARFFGEGITVFGDKLIQLTWRSDTGFVYDKNNFKLLGKFNYKTEGWGITHDGRRLIMSDGSATLYFLNPETYEMTGRLEVADNNGPVTRLNELEYVRGEIYANVWQTDNIAIIDTETGRVKGWIDLGKLSQLAGGDKATKTLNGIAYDKEADRLFVTGKLWPDIYEIKLVPLTPDP